MCTVGFFAYLLSKMSMILQELDEDIQKYKKELEIMNKFMENKGIGFEL